jgi:hypothetical protein
LAKTKNQSYFSEIISALSLASAEIINRLLQLKRAIFLRKINKKDIDF